MNERGRRQSFLGKDSDGTLARARIAIIGASGGGSHIGQQLAHVGVGHVDLIDPAICEERHRNRMIGISKRAIKRRWQKVFAVQHLMRRVHPEGDVVPHPVRWQEAHLPLREADIVFSCVDGYSEREEIERYTRRFHIPLIDIGMDVRSGERGHVICGQVITSMPGGPCMRCLGFLTEAAFQSEAARYGAAGDRPQVVWPNGVLASTAVGIGIAMLLPWHRDQIICPYLIYDCNKGTVCPSPRLIHIGTRCHHFDDVESYGDPLWEGLT